MSIVEYDVTDSSRKGVGAGGAFGIEGGFATGMSWEKAESVRAQSWDGERLVLPGCVA